MISKMLQRLATYSAFFPELSNYHSALDPSMLLTEILIDVQPGTLLYDDFVRLWMFWGKMMEVEEAF